MSDVIDAGADFDLDIDELAFQIISFAGDGKSKVMEAVKAYGSGADDQFERCMLEAEAEFAKAHRAQVKYLQQQVIKQDANTPVLIVHAMDILMTAMSEKDLASSLIQAMKNRSSLPEQKDSR